MPFQSTFLTVLGQNGVQLEIIELLLYNEKVRRVPRISKDFPKNRNFWKIDRTSSGNKFFSFQDMKKL